jgi:hypothetical protein
MAQITVNSRVYDLVTIDQLTLDEAIVIWDYAHLSIDQIPDMDGFHPGVVAALIHISVARAEPGETARTIRRTVGQIKVADLEQVFMDISEDTDQVPPPDAPSSSSPSDGSGADSSGTGAPDPDNTQANGSGSPGSATGAPSAPVILAP